MEHKADVLVIAHPFDHLLQTAWTIIANAGGGDWTKETNEWHEAATRWRDEYHAYLHPLIVRP